MEPETLRAALDGDRAALNEMCRALYPPLHRFLSGLLRTREGADDLCQASLLRVLSALKSYRALPGRTFEAWAFRIAYNLFLDEKRKRQPVPLDEDFDPPDPAPPPDVRAERNERAFCVRRAVNRLDDESRAMVVMRYELELSYREIAVALATPAARVKWRLHDALKKLEVDLRKEGFS